MIPRHYKHEFIGDELFCLYLVLGNLALDDAEVDVAGVQELHDPLGVAH